MDILVEFEKGKTPGFFRLMEIRRDLEVFLGVEAVDLRMLEDLSPYFRDEVMANAEVQYALA